FHVDERPCLRLVTISGAIPQSCLIGGTPHCQRRTLVALRFRIPRGCTKGETSQPVVAHVHAPELSANEACLTSRHATTACTPRWAFPQELQLLAGIVEFAIHVHRCQKGGIVQTV